MRLLDDATTIEEPGAGTSTPPAYSYLAFLTIVASTRLWASKSKRLTHHCFLFIPALDLSTPGKLIVRCFREPSHFAAGSRREAVVRQSLTDLPAKTGCLKAGLGTGRTDGSSELLKFA